MPKLMEVMETLEALAPKHLAEAWDNVGLMVGNRNQEVSKVLCCLDLNEAVLEEALMQKADCIVTHHPFIFKPLKHIDLQTPVGRMVQTLLVNNIAVYSMHTNYDIATGGINDYLAQGLGLNQIKPLVILQEDPIYKVSVYVPESHWELVRETIVKLESPQIGKYLGCTFSEVGEGTFIPLEGSSPYLGTSGQLEKVREKKISWICYRSMLNEALAKVRAVHPYEEVAFDVFALENMKNQEGIGRVGYLEKPILLEDFIKQVKDYFNCKQLRINSNDNLLVERIAVCSGAGSEYIAKASQVADVYITGDVKFHEAQLAQSLGLVVIDIGHYCSEVIAIEPMAKWLSDHYKTLQVYCSKINGETLFIK